MCELSFATYGNMHRHLRQAASCKWWPTHAKEAAEKLSAPPAPNIVLGSIFDTSNGFWEDDEDDAMSGGEEEPGEEGDTTSDDEDNTTVPEFTGPSPELLRELMEMNDPEDFYDVVHPNLAVGEEGPGPSTLRARLNRMLGARRRYLDDDEADGEEEGRVFDDHPTGGGTVKMARTLHERWAALFGMSGLPKTSDAKMDGSGESDLTLCTTSN